MSEGTRKRYVIQEQIARGGMGAVFRARKLGTGGFHRVVAIKLLHDSKALDVDARTMLRQEAEIGAMLDHPNIVPVWDFDEDSKQCVRLIMPYVDGVDLEDLLDTGMLPISVSVYVIVSILRGLAHAHSRGILHRDIKPGNILISRAGAVQITDFGLARDPAGIHLAAQLDAGTFGYMSPEALQSDWQDARSDLFAVGAMFYELLTGIRAFPGVHYLERVAQTLCQTPPPPVEVRPTVPQEFSDVAMRLLAPKPADRFPSAQAVIDVLPQPGRGMDDLAALVKERIEQGRISIPAISTPPRPRTERVPADARNTRAMRDSVLARALAEVGEDPGLAMAPMPVAREPQMIVLPGPGAAKHRRRGRWLLLALAALAMAIVGVIVHAPWRGQHEDAAQDREPPAAIVSQGTPREPDEGEPDDREPDEGELGSARNERAQDQDARFAKAANKATAPRPAPGPARRRKPATDPIITGPVAAPPRQAHEPVASPLRPTPQPRPATEPAEYHIPIGRDQTLQKESERTRAPEHQDDGAADQDEPAEHHIVIRRKGEKP